METQIGKSLRRREDLLLIQGGGNFLADLRFPNTKEAVFIRSPHAHARVLGFELDHTLQIDRVQRVFTAADLPRTKFRIPSTAKHAAVRSMTDPVLAYDEVKYVGEPVAVVLADDRYAAEDAAELVNVDYETLPACVDIEGSFADGSPLVHLSLGSNLAGEKIWEVGNPAAVLDRNAYVIFQQLRVHRGTSSPMETRGIVAIPDKAGDTVLDIWSSTQSPYRARDLLAEMLALPPEKIRVRAPFVGGGFGPKSGFYPEDFIVPWLALTTGSPIRWVEDRREHLLCARQERDQIHDVTVAFSREGEILALWDDFIYDVGAYSTAVVAPWNTACTLPGPYKIPNAKIHMKLSFTNKVPTMTVRGAGRPQAVFVMERVIETIARNLRVDPAEIRRRNFASPKDLPWDTGLKARDGESIIYDSGDFPQVLDTVLRAADYWAVKQQFATANTNKHVKLGIGVACYVAATGRGPFEMATVSVDTTGTVTVSTGSCPQGQGHQTSLAQVCSDTLGAEDIRVLFGDTFIVPHGLGTFASRSAVAAGNAVAEAAKIVREKLIDLAGQARRSSHGPIISWVDGAYWKINKEEVTFKELVRVIHDRSVKTSQAEQFPVQATVRYEIHSHTYACGAHAALVQVDVLSGEVKVIRYIAVHDCGHPINPMIVEGQLHGGIAHGIGNSLFEKIEYDGNGQVLSSTFKDYLLPLSTDLSSIEVTLLEFPTSKNPLGIKGVGESGAVAAPAAIVAAIENALSEWKIAIDTVPISPEYISTLIEVARRNQSRGDHDNA